MTTDPPEAHAGPRPPSPPETSRAVREARGALKAGELWRARDVLTERVDRQRDSQALVMLGEVLHSMGDLPAAGAVWFGTGVRGAQVAEATEAWRNRHGDDFTAMWHSLPASVRREPRTAKVEALRAKALADSADERSQPEPTGKTAGGPAEPAEKKGGLDSAQVIAWALAALVVVCTVVGLVTILGWLVPG